MASYINLWLDHPKVGCGNRAYLVLKEGRTKARIICTETAEAITIPRSALAKARPLPLKPTRLAKRLRAIAKTYGRDGSGSVRLACQLLRAG